MNNVEELREWNRKKMTIPQITKLTGICGRTLRSRYQAAGLKYIKVTPFNSPSNWDLSKIVNPNDKDGQYLIGLLAADGYLVKHKAVVLWLQSRDIELLYRAKDILDNPEASILTRRRDHGSYQVGLYIGSIRLVEYLKENYGFSNRKSRTLPFPSHINDPRAFLRGYFDGDGYMGQSCTFTIGSSDFAEDFLNWIEDEYHYYPNVQLCGTNKDIYNIHFRKKHEDFIHDLFDYRGLTRKTQAYIHYFSN